MKATGLIPDVSLILKFVCVYNPSLPWQRLHKGTRPRAHKLGQHAYKIIPLKQEVALSLSSGGQ
jgi:hypothetical protein